MLLILLYVFVNPVLSFFFLKIRPPPRSTLFPYTTLFPISGFAASMLILCLKLFFLRLLNGERVGHHPRRCLYHRSEEHTSELQSRLHLVCRLLLEKKNI